MSDASSNLRINLLDNACHSLQRGYEMLSQGRRKKDALLLKESIIWIHHGIELSLKQLLAQLDEYLVFENVDEAVRKLAHLRRQSNMTHASVFDLFDYGSGVRTVGFNKLIERVAIMLNLPVLATGSHLRDKIDELTNYRNKIVHFAVEVNLDEVVSLLSDLMEPFLALLEREIQDEKFIQRCIPYIRANSKSIMAVYDLKKQDAEKRIGKLMRKFNGQEVPGRLFGLLDDGVILLPAFSKIDTEIKLQDIRADILAKCDSEQWVVEIKIHRPNFSQMHRLLYQFQEFQEKLSQREITVRPWLIMLGSTRPFMHSAFRQQGILISSESDILELERMLNE